jgi:hypothetical protein
MVIAMSDSLRLMALPIGTALRATILEHAEHARVEHYAQCPVCRSMWAPDRINCPNDRTPLVDSGVIYVRPALPRLAGVTWRRRGAVWHAFYSDRQSSACRRATVTATQLAVHAITLALHDAVCGPCWHDAVPFARRH